jgi:hypothetical protein
VSVRRILALLVLGVLGCVDVGAGQVSVPLHVAGTAIAEPIVGHDGALIDLDRAELAFGPIYLCAGAQAGSLCETARLEWLDAVVVDVLDPAAVEAGELRGVEGTVRSWMFDLGLVSLLTQNQPLIMAAAAELGGVSLRLEGRARLGELELPFAMAVIVAQDEQTEAGVPVIRKSTSDAFNHDVRAGEPGLLVRFDAGPWVTQIDFGSLLEDRECAPAGPAVVCAGQLEHGCDDQGQVVATRDCAEFGQVCVRERGCVDHIEFSTDSQGYRAVRNQVAAGPRPRFEWGFSP